MYLGVDLAPEGLSPFGQDGAVRSPYKVGGTPPVASNMSVNGGAQQFRSLEHLLYRFPQATSSRPEVQIVRQIEMLRIC
jgi:hypothetical protein